MSESTARVAILDAGSQFSKVIDRRVRQLSVHSEIVPLSTPLSALSQYSALIISGGPGSVTADDAPMPDPAVLESSLPILGVCYGMQLMAMAAGGHVAAGEVRQDGVFSISTNPCPLWARLAEEGKTRVLLTHGDCVDDVGAGARVVATSEEGIVAALEVEGKPHYGVQFHPEVDLSEEGMAILSAFLFDIAAVPADYTLGSRKDDAISYVRAMVGDEAKVLVLVSGGVDSSVCASLVTAAIGPERVVCIHVDNGFMRKGESDLVSAALSAVGLEPIVIDGGETFYNAHTEVDGVDVGPLNSEVNPEHVRKIIGDTFMRVTNAKAKELGLDPDSVFLAQGTLRPDLIESASKLANASANAAVIKTHHNDTALVRVLRDAGRVVEPLQEYHKDEVRVLGRELGLPEALVARQPFPGPGLAIRILCTEAPFFPASADADRAVLAKVAAVRPEYPIALLPVATVGVQGDGRSYTSLAGISSPAEITSSADVDWEHVFASAVAIPKRAKGVNRVAFVFGGPVEDGSDVAEAVTVTHLTPDVIATLQEADAAVNAILEASGLVRTLAQVPVVLVPLGFGTENGHSIAIRTMVTNDFMTGSAAVPGTELMPHSVLDELVAAVSGVEGIGRVLYDCTGKPPGTTEWQ